MHVPGVELPLRDGKLNAHITVMRPDDIAKIGGADKITERGHVFTYSLGATKSVKPNNWDGVGRVWYVTVKSPELEALRRSYGLSSLPNDGKHDLHVTTAIRKKMVTQNNSVSKAAKVCLAEQTVPDKLPGGEADGLPDSDFDAGELAMGVEDEKEHTDDPALAKEIAKDHLKGERPDYYTALKRLEKKSAEDMKLTPRFAPGADPAVAQAAETGFMDSFAPQPVRPGIVETAARAAGPTALAAYSHLPRIRGLDSAVGGAVGALGGLGVEATRRAFGKKTKNSLMDYLRSAAVGGVAGAGAGNLIGDRARRYVSNTLIPMSYSSHDPMKDPVQTSVSPLQRLLPADFRQFWDAAVLDRPAHIARFQELSRGTPPLLPNGEPDLSALRKQTQQAFKNDPRNSARVELIRRELGVHTDDPVNDVWARQPDGSYSLNPEKADIGRYLPLITGQVPENGLAKRPLDVLRQAGSDSGAEVDSLMRRVVGGQIPRLTVTGSTPNPDPNKTPAAKLMATVRDRWDYTLDPRERDYLQQGLLRAARDREWARQPVPADMVDDYTQQDTTNADLLGRLLGRQGMDWLADEHPWVHQHLALDPIVNKPEDVQSSGMVDNYRLRPLTAAGMPYPAQSKR
jgi:hypothetical protein